jgi:broad specificity phosphatase PhoE
VAGEQQAHHAARALQGRGLRAVASSSLSRAVRTAQIIADALRLPVVAVDPALNERSGGLWTGRTFDEIETAWPGMRALVYSGQLPAPPGGETTAELCRRATEALGRMTASLAQHGPLLVITHKGVLTALELPITGRDGAYPSLAGRWYSIRGAMAALGTRVSLLDPS